MDGSNPTLLYGYGGFGNIAQPNYYPLGLFFANNLNGVYALANTRGNGYDIKYNDDLILKYINF